MLEDECGCRCGDTQPTTLPTNKRIEELEDQLALAVEATQRWEELYNERDKALTKIIQALRAGGFVL